jgi:acyl-CoA reductase-like NAD-dependent aldehyde dehydrogenase
MSNTTQWELLESFQRLFPVAVWAWNTACWICGDVCVWKPSEKYHCVVSLVKILLKQSKKK